jgi:hypothetical protein
MPDSEPRNPEVGVAWVAGAIEDTVIAAVNATTRRLTELPGARARRLRRLARQPLPFLYEVHPEARRAIPHQLGVQTIQVADIAGTAVGPPGQRGMDFLPPRPLRTPNWRERWQRIRAATDRLAILPPIDVQWYADRYWVLDGHNRVAIALYVGQPEIDANVVELASPGGRGVGAHQPVANALEERSELQAVMSRRTAAATPPEEPGAERKAGPPTDDRP